MKKLLLIFWTIPLILSVAAVSWAETFGGVDFPAGVASFADVVVSYDPIINAQGGPNAPYVTPSQALGPPDYPTGTIPVGFVSLGSGGSITLQFTDNSLTGSGTDAADLWIFEVGPEIESTFVEISKDGIVWNSVGGIVQGGTRGVDIDAYGWTQSDYFSYVRLTDNPNQGTAIGTGSVGADIDAVGAISSAPPVSTPEPATMLLLGSGLIGLWGAIRKFKK